MDIDQAIDKLKRPLSQNKYFTSLYTQGNWYGKTFEAGDEIILQDDARNKYYFKAKHQITSPKEDLSFEDFLTFVKQNFAFIKTLTFWQHRSF